MLADGSAGGFESLNFRVQAGRGELEVPCWPEAVAVQGGTSGAKAEEVGVLGVGVVVRAALSCTAHQLRRATKSLITFGEWLDPLKEPQPSNFRVLRRENGFGSHAAPCWRSNPLFPKLPITPS